MSRLVSPLAIVATLLPFVLMSWPSLPVTGPQDPTPPTLEPYDEVLPGAVKLAMVPIPAGKFTIGSPDTESGRQPDEGPQRQVEVGAFWIGRTEITWEQYELWASSRDTVVSKDPDLRQRVDAVSRPTPPYTDMTFGMGRDGFPAICMTQHAARTYCEWLTAVTGKPYRLPTEAEWEYACRAGTATAYSFGADGAKLGDYAWFKDNSLEAYHRVGQKQPNPFGLYDMHGNVCEWVLDQYDAEFYAKLGNDRAVNPLSTPVKEYPHTVRGGSWEDAPGQLRCAARRGSDPSWKEQDPQIPKSIWYHTDALFVGLRVVRPLDPQPKPDK